LSDEITTKISARLLNNHVKQIDAFAKKTSRNRSELIEYAIVRLMKQRDKLLKNKETD
jgi:metal-responsive CopG/Arc/MetJ family transcriptional regulator